MKYTALLLLLLLACSGPAKTTTIPSEGVPEVVVEDTPPPPAATIAEPEPDGEGPATVNVACSFDDGFVAIVPAGVFDPNEQFTMQALIGFTEDPSFWQSIDEYRHLEPHAAERCDRDGTALTVEPGEYFLLVGWAGRFRAHRGYNNNGYLERMQLRLGERRRIDLSPKQLDHGWACISCPYLLAWLPHAPGKKGRWIELGQVLIDRYSARREGSDAIRARVGVDAGRVRVRIAEREPEVTFLRDVSVTVAGKRLRRMTPLPERLAMGEHSDVVFDAGVLPDGAVDAIIEVRGHYEPVGPLW